MRPRVLGFRPPGRCPLCQHSAINGKVTVYHFFDCKLLGYARSTGCTHALTQPGIAKQAA